jgi:DNA polymerase III delta subunit
MGMQPSIVYLSGAADAVSHRRSEMLAEAGWDGEVFDGADGGALINALRTPPLFAERRVVALENLEALDPAVAEAVAALHTTKPVLVVARSGERSPTAKLLRALGSTVSTEKCGAAKPADRRSRLVALEAEYGVRLEQRSRAVLLDAYGEEVERARSVLWQLGVLGVVPDAGTFAAMISSCGAEQVPWAPLESFAAGDTPAALGALGTLEPVVVLSFISRDVLGAAWAAESGSVRSEEIESALGVNRFAAKRVLRLSRRLGRSGIAALWPYLLEAETAVRGSHGDAALELFIARACSLGQDT